MNKITILFLLSLLIGCRSSIEPVIKYYEKDGEQWYEKRIYCYPKGKYPATKGKRKLAIIQQFKGNTLYESKVFYELWPNGESKFVSSEGFYKYKNGEYQLLNDSINIPDNIIFEDYRNHKTYFYKNGIRVLYTLGLQDGVKEYIYEGDKPGVYIWKNGKRTFLRELSESEKPKEFKLKKE